MPALLLAALIASLIIDAPEDVTPVMEAMRGAGYEAGCKEPVVSMWLIGATLYVEVTCRTEAGHGGRLE